MTLLVYVAAPFEDAAVVRVFHEVLEREKVTPTSRWANSDGPEDFSRFTPAALREIAQRNDADLRGSDVVVVMARHGAGGEMFAEARLALEWGKPVVWVGRRTLSAWRTGVVRVDELPDALLVLRRMRDGHAEGYRGLLLAHLAGVAA